VGGLARVSLAFVSGALLSTALDVLGQPGPARIPSAGNESRVALVVGNSGYAEAPLKNPVNDAADMARALRGLSFDVDLRTDASRADMKTALRRFARHLREGGVGLFYYAGHGIQSRGRNYLIPVDASIQSEAELEYESVDANLVLSYMDNARSRVNIVILDACRNNPFARSFRSVSRGLAQMEGGRGTFIAFATAPGSVAADGDGRNGLYTRYLLESLKHRDSDIGRVFRRVTAEVSRTTGGEQVPWISSSLTGDFYFDPGSRGPSAVQSAAVLPQAAAMELAFWDTIKNSSNPADFREYLKQFPDGSFAGLANIRLEALSASSPQAASPTHPSTADVPKPTTAEPLRNEPPSQSEPSAKPAARVEDTTQIAKARPTAAPSLGVSFWKGTISCEPYSSLPESRFDVPVVRRGDVFIVKYGFPGARGSFEVHGERENDGSMRLDGSGVSGAPGAGTTPYPIYFSGSFLHGKDRYQSDGRMGGRSCSLLIELL